MTKAIKRVTKIPGPRGKALLRMRESEIPKSAAMLTEIIIDKAKGTQVTDVDGNTFLDFSGGIGVLNVGHSHPAVVEAVRAQVENLTHACSHVMLYEPYLKLAQKVNQLTPGKFHKKTMFANSGAEAVDNAIKLARHFTGRPAVVCFEHAFHGRTITGLSLTGKHSPYKRGFGPFLPEIYRMPFPYCYRCPSGLEPESCGIHCKTWIDNFFATHVDAESVAAVIFEPILGEGGFVSFPQPFIERLVEFCREKGILLIADEIQTGWGRTGKMFAVEHYGIEPDIIVMAKSLAGGMPLSAFTARAEIMDHPQKGGLGTTYGGNPVCCAAALAAIDVIQKQNLVERANFIGVRVRKRFQEMQDEYHIIGDVRGMGAMNALELVTDRVQKTPATAETATLIKKCWQNGLVLLKAGSFGNCIRTLMPLVISDAELDEGLSVLEKAIATI